MATAGELVARVAATNGDFPARISTTAAALAGVAECRFALNSQLLVICRTPSASTDAGISANGCGAGFDNDDARVLAFFLAENAALRSLECVNGARMGRDRRNGGGAG